MKPRAFASTVCLRSAGDLRAVRLGCPGTSIASLEVFSRPPGSYVSEPTSQCSRSIYKFAAPCCNSGV